MRHLITLAAVAILAGCTVDVEGAACLDDANCPAGQRCGYGGSCSVAAAACPGPICQEHECSGQTARRCVVSGEGPCASFVEEVCSAYEDCSPASGTCGCKDTPCLPGVNAFCDASGDRVVCATDPGSQCRYVASTAGCGLGETCGGAPDATCSCPVAGANVGDGCDQEGKTSCLGSNLLDCVPKVAGSTCLVWSLVEDCAGASLVCDPGAAGPPEVAAACLCPPHLESPVVLHADPSAATRPNLARNGALEPSSCRYVSLAAAVAGASSGNTVKAIGYAGTPVTFTEGPFTIPEGVSVTTDDATPTPGNYVVEPSAAVGAATFVTLRPGASATGVTFRNTTASGVGIETNCTDAGDTATVTLETIQIAGLGTGGGAAPPRFANGLRHGGNCPLVLSGSTVEGADDTGVLITDAASSTSLTMIGNLIQLNQANVTSYTIGSSDRSGGGLVIYGTHPGTVTFLRNVFLSNAGDQVLIFSPGTLDLSTPGCGADSNTFACYAAPGVGLSSRFGTVNVAHSFWQNDLPVAGTDFVAATGATIVGAGGLSCGGFTEVCP